MGKKPKSITINNCYQFKTGRHKVALPDKDRARLKIQGTDKDSKCTLTFRTENEYGQRVEHTWIDKGCDGVRIDKRTKVTGKKTKTPPALDLLTYDDAPSDDDIAAAFFRGDPVMSHAMRQINRRFSYEPCRRVGTLAPSPRRGRIRSRGGTSSRLYPEIHFGTAKSVIRPEDKKVLDNFVRRHRGGGILIEGHCDHRGDEDYNLALGKRRAQATKKYLTKAFKVAKKKVPEIIVMSIGEAKPTGESLEADRRAVIVGGARGQKAAKRVVTERALKISKTEAYLIDASGSMQDVWDIVKGHQFPKAAKIYSFNNCQHVHVGIPLRADCGTPLWSSLETVINQMNDKATLTLISDGADDAGANESARKMSKIIKLASDKGVAINVVYLGEPNESHASNMRQLAKGTGGKFYIRTE